MLDKTVLPVWSGGWVDLVAAGWVGGLGVYGIPYNKPLLCNFVCELLSGKEAVALFCFVQAFS